jgi:Ca-activated chloride channel family protein
MVSRQDSWQGGPGFGTALVLVTLLALLALGLQAWRAGDVTSLWLTADQQGRRAYQRLAFREAFDAFSDPAWKGVAAYEAGLYEDAAAAFGRIPTARGFFNRGNALMKNREYAKAITAYQQAVTESPGWTEAEDNLRLARYVLEYIERVREQSDTGDDTELSADDYVFDNTQQRGLEVEITQQSTIELESAEKWMRGVDTETGDFLRTRFLLEAVREGTR